MRLSNFQKDTLQDILDQRYLGIFASMSMGKTLVNLLAIEHLKHFEELRATLIVAPILVGETVWPAEIEKWDIDLTATVIRGKPKERIARLRAKTDIHIINFELIPWLVQQPEFAKFRVLILDEVTRLASTGGVWHRALYNARAQFRMIIGLTGTPSAGGEENLYGIMRIIADDRVWKTKEQFLSMYFKDISKNKADYSTWRIRDERSRKKLFKDIAKHVVSYHEKDNMDLPPYVPVDIWLELTPSMRRDYDQMEKNFFLELDETVIESVNGGVKVQKLRQLLSGFVYGEDGTAYPLDSIKMWAAREILSDMDDTCLIGYQFTEEKKEIIEAFHAEIISRKNKGAVAKWNAGKLHRAAGHPKSFGHGLNMQDGGFNILWYSLPWSLEQYQQTNARLRRNGQKEPVTLIRLLFKDTIDEAVVAALDSREENQEKLYDELTAYRDRRARRLREEHPGKNTKRKRTAHGRTPKDRGRTARKNRRNSRVRDH